MVKDLFFSLLLRLSKKECLYILKRINDVDEIHFEMSKIKSKLKDLSSLHDKHLNRPTLDDNLDEEKSIDNLTQEITNV